MKPKITPKLMAPPNFVNLQKDPQGYFCGYRTGKKKIKEQVERYATPEEAVDALR